MKYSSLLYWIVAFVCVFALTNASSTRAQSKSIQKELKLIDAMPTESPDDRGIYKSKLYNLRDLTEQEGDHIGRAEAGYRLALYYEMQGVEELAAEELEKGEVFLKQHDDQQATHPIYQKYIDFYLKIGEEKRAERLKEMIQN